MINAMGEMKLVFRIKWKCSPEEVLKKCNNAKDYHELVEILYENMIITLMWMGEPDGYTLSR